MDWSPQDNWRQLRYLHVQSLQHSPCTEMIGKEMSNLRTGRPQEDKERTFVGLETHQQQQGGLFERWQLVLSPATSYVIDEPPRVINTAGVINPFPTSLCRCSNPLQCKITRMQIMTITALRLDAQSFYQFPSVSSASNAY